ncbi:recombinase family protein [Haloimpatiens sp. FM7330]|uniref:recombinase family protein n=1 Tax=Haloimpatiens sp. FM7330 TaxID=3298610 RepID=UPI003637E7AB
MEKIHVLIYLRKSRGDEEKDLENHKRTLIELCESKGYSYEICSEVGSSDSIEFRPVFSEIYDEIKNRENAYEGIVIHDYDRLSRNGKDLELIKELFLNNNIKVITPYKTYDFTNEADDLNADLMGFVAKLEFKQIKKRLKAGKIAGAKAGKWVNGTPPYGYIYNRADKTLIIDEDKARIVRYVFEEIKKGEALYNIAHSLNCRGERTSKGKLWSHTAIYRMATSHTYKGTYVYGKTKGSGHKNRKTTPIERKDSKEWIVVENAFPRIVTVELWEVVNQILKDRKLVGKKTVASLTPLSGLIRCGVCGSSMVVQKARKNKWSDTIKKCQHRDLVTNELCKNRGISVITVLNLVFDDIKNYRNELIEYLKNAEGKDKELEAIIKEIETLNKDIERYTDTLERVTDSFDEGIYTKDEYISRRNKWMGRIEVSEERIEQLEKRLKLAESVQIEDKIAVLDGIIESYNNNLSDKEINRLLKSIIKDIRLTRIGDEPLKIEINFL